MGYYRKRRQSKAFHARVAGFVDYVTSATPTKIDINLQQDNFNQLLPLMSRFRYYKAKGLSVMAQPATTLPLNPMQIGDGANMVKATDILTPCAIRRFYNEYDTVTKDADGVTQVLSDQKWQKFWPQKGFRMYFKPYMYGVGSTATGPLRLNGTVVDVTGTQYYQPGITGLDANDEDPNVKLQTGPPITETESEFIKGKQFPTITYAREQALMGSQSATGMDQTGIPNWPDGMAPIREAWGAWGGIKPIGIQPVRRGIDGQFSFPMMNLGRIFMPGYTSVVYTWRLWWTLYVDLMSPKFHLEPGDELLNMGMSMAQRETVFTEDGTDITGTLYDTVQDPGEEIPYPSQEPL